MNQLFADLFSNFLVQVFLGIGMMVALIILADGFRLFGVRRDKRQEKELEMRIKSSSQEQIEKLRGELSQLRDTLVDHSMSLDQNVEHLSKRVDSLEQRINVGGDR